MFKRIACGALWFLTIGWGFSFLNLIIGAPPVIGLILAASGSAFIAVDPLHVFWPARVLGPTLTPPETVRPVSGAMQTQV
jgi:hypothetical protein